MIITVLANSAGQTIPLNQQIFFRIFNILIGSHLVQWSWVEASLTVLVLEKFEVKCVQDALITTRNQFVSNPTVSANPVKLIVGSRRPEVYLKFFVINPLLLRPTSLNRWTIGHGWTVLSDNKNSLENICPMTEYYI